MEYEYLGVRCVLHRIMDFYMLVSLDDSQVLGLDGRWLPRWHVNRKYFQSVAEFEDWLSQQVEPERAKRPRIHCPLY